MKKRVISLLLIMITLICLPIYASGSRNATTEWINPFNDIKEDAWFYEAVKFVNDNNLFKGATETKFEPNAPMTRGMMVTVLWRVEKEPVVNYLMQFEDVNVEEYYGEAIRWATSEKIVTGYSNAEFKPDEMLSRQEMVTMLYRYAKYKEMDMALV